jgi:L-2-hydroxyglutarate oxidase LhgO
MLSLLGEVESNGGALALRSPLLGAREIDAGFALDIGGVPPMRMHSRILVNAAGLRAPATALSIDGMPRSRVPRGHFAKGNYFTLGGRTPFRHLIYPVPEPGGLGVHVTLDMAGGARFGPDVEWIDAIDYSVDTGRGGRFYAAIRRYWPGLPEGALIPGYAGVRPKISGPGEPARDFVIQGPAHHGVPGLVNLFGIESPGLTASLAIADEVTRIVEGTSLSD